jgi:hypothetical protein
MSKYMYLFYFANVAFLFLQGYIEDVFRFVIFILHYVCVLVMMVLSCFLERVPVQANLNSDLVSYSNVLHL